MLLRLSDVEFGFEPLERATAQEAAAAAAAAAAGVRSCGQCLARQPARAHHCKRCNKCVHTFDHHCGVLGTCIGERNRLRFFLFLLAQTTALAYAIGLLNTSLVWQRATSDWLAVNALPLFLLLLLWLLQLFVLPLFVLHCWLAATNTTSAEVFLGARRLWYLAGTQPQECDLPYSSGLCQNLRLFCCALDTWTCMRWRHRAAPAWVGRVWPFPGPVERDSEDLCSNPWNNR